MKNNNLIIKILVYNWNILATKIRDIINMSMRTRIFQNNWKPKNVMKSAQ